MATPLAEEAAWPNETPSVDEAEDALVEDGAARDLFYKKKKSFYNK